MLYTTNSIKGGKMLKYVILLVAVMCGNGMADVSKVSFGLKAGAISQNFSEILSGPELWYALGTLIEIKIPNSSFSVRGDGGISLYQKEEGESKTTKSDIHIQLVPKCLWELASAETGVWGGEAPSRMGISTGLGLGVHFLNGQEKVQDSLSNFSEVGIGVNLFGGIEYLIGSYILFVEVGWGKILRGDFFQEGDPWTQLTFLGGVRL
jgi:hypothetical protein